MPHIVLIIVNFNAAGDTLQCLASILRLHHAANLEILVVDNASTDSSLQMLHAFAVNHQQIMVIRQKSNQGYAAGCNAGIEYAQMHRRPDYFWLLNNDTKADGHSLSALLSSAKAHPLIKIWGSTIRDMHPPLALQCSGGFGYVTALSIPFPLKSDPAKFNGRTCVQDNQLAYISGVSMFVRAEVFDRGLMDASYFLYYEELELVRLAGGRQHIAWCPESIIYHQGGATTGGADPNRGQGSYAAHYYGNRSALRYTWKYNKGYFPLVFLFRFVTKCLLFIWYREWRGFRPMWKAYRDFAKSS